MSRRWPTAGCIGSTCGSGEGMSEAKNIKRVLRPVDELLIPVIVFLLLAAAIILVNVDIEKWVVSMVLVWSALVLAILDRGQR